MTAEYNIRKDGSNYWRSFRNYCHESGLFQDRVWTLTGTIDLMRPVLAKFHGEFILSTGSDGISGSISGIVFDTSEDLLFFKLTFN